MMAFVRPSATEAFGSRINELLKQQALVNVARPSVVCDALVKSLLALYLRGFYDNHIMVLFSFLCQGFN